MAEKLLDTLRRIRDSGKREMRTKPLYTDWSGRAVTIDVWDGIAELEALEAEVERLENLVSFYEDLVDDEESADWPHGDVRHRVHLSRRLAEVKRLERELKRWQHMVRVLQCQIDLTHEHSIGIEESTRIQDGRLEVWSLGEWVDVEKANEDAEAIMAGEDEAAEAAGGE